MRSIFDNLDQLIEQAVANATHTEKSLQKKQEKSVEKRGIKAEKEEQKEDVEEADDEEDSKESKEKIKGKSPDDKGEDSKKSDEVPGTKTSKKLADPSEKTIADPKFDDISNKVNALRGSGSLKDEKVSSAVKSYIKTLQPAERSALLVYLTNLAQIMATVKSSSDVKDPSEIGIKTSFKSKSSSDEKEAKEKPKKDDEAGVIVVGGK